MGVQDLGLGQRLSENRWSLRLLEGRPTREEVALDKWHCGLRGGELLLSLGRREHKNYGMSKLNTSHWFIIYGNTIDNKYQVNYIFTTKVLLNCLCNRRKEEKDDFDWRHRRKEQRCR